MKIIKGLTFDLERSLYNLKDTIVDSCIFKGPNDGESVLKEARDIEVLNSNFSLRYPLWHVVNFKIVDSLFDEPSRAPLWYDMNGTIINCVFKSVKAVRECNNLLFDSCDIDSIEFGWKSNNLSLNNCKIISPYVFLDSNNIEINKLTFEGKYSFQYVNNLTIKDSVLNTKDAFWHSNNVTVYNSIINGEYLAWFSKNLTLINCKIKGTQPFCYCENLKLIDCIMEDCDLSFEYSAVDAKVLSHIDSIKNPKEGKIICKSVGEIIKEDSIVDNNCIIETYEN